MKRAVIFYDPRCPYCMLDVVVVDYFNSHTQLLKPASFNTWAVIPTLYTGNKAPLDTQDRKLLVLGTEKRVIIKNLTCPFCQESLIALIDGDLTVPSEVYGKVLSERYYCDLVRENQFIPLVCESCGAGIYHVSDGGKCSHCGKILDAQCGGPIHSDLCSVCEEDQSKLADSFDSIKSWGFTIYTPVNYLLGIIHVNEMGKNTDMDAIFRTLLTTASELAAHSRAPSTGDIWRAAQQIDPEFKDFPYLNLMNFTSLLKEPLLPLHWNESIPYHPIGTFPPDLFFDLLRHLPPESLRPFSTVFSQILQRGDFRHRHETLVVLSHSGFGFLSDINITMTTDWLPSPQELNDLLSDAHNVDGVEWVLEYHAYEHYLYWLITCIAQHGGLPEIAKTRMWLEGLDIEIIEQLSLPRDISVKFSSTNE